MPRLIALMTVFALIWWLWRRWQQHSLPSQKPQQNAETQKLQQCIRCDAMLPSQLAERKEIAKSCEHGGRCPLKLES